MNPLDQADTWTQANQALLVAELARLKQRLGAPADSTALAAALQSARAALPAPAAIDRLSEAFDLSPFERDLLLLCAGVEMDAALAALCEEGAGGAHRCGASFGLALAVLDAPHWSALAPVRPLRRWRLLALDEAAGLTRGLLRIDARVLDYLAGVNYLDPRLASLLQAAPAPSHMAPTQRGVAQAVHAAIDAAPDPGQPPLVWLTGDDPAGQADVAAEAAAARGAALYLLDIDALPSTPAELDALATLWQRDALLLDAALLLQCGAQTLSSAALRWLDSLRGPVFVSAAQPQALARAAVRFAVDKPGPLEQKALWRAALGLAPDADPQPMAASLDAVASQFRLSARAIQAEATQLAPELDRGDAPSRLLWAACRRISRARLDDLAQRIDATADWSELVLPAPQLHALHQIAAQVRHRLTVYQAWGFAQHGTRGRGISVLFSGESGTGKTLAAEVLARELELDLYRIDLSAVVSKYIGETEKNLRRVFDAAEDGGAILLFDEADALFGKRSEVKDSHDRYANIEVSYLLQRMESYGGLAILTTNLKGALDPAFQRRLRFVVQFPFPDLAQREAIWRNALPAATPRASIDHAKLARLNATGGSIRNIALNAAFDAADRGEPVSMAHLRQSAQHEASKRERALSDAETRGWV